MRRFVLDNSLTLFFVAILLLALFGQSIAGLAAFNADQLSVGLPVRTYGRYLTSSSFAVDVAENWQSEFLQFTLYILATVWLVQRGSSESKELRQVRSGIGSRTRRWPSSRTRTPPAWARRRGWRLAPLLTAHSPW